MLGGLRDEEGDPPRRHPQDRDVVPPGRAVPATSALLGEHGILYPADRFDAHFLAALDLMRLPWGGLEREAVGAWDRLAAEVRELGRHTAIISHEILATASRSQVGRALESLGHQRDGSGVEVHLVLSVRDLVRQIPAEWQENVKHRSGDQLRPVPRADHGTRARNSRIASWFWGVQEVPGDPGPVGPRPAARADPPGDRAVARAARPTCCGSGSAAGVRPGRASTSTSRTSGPTRRSASPRPR